MMKTDIKWSYFSIHLGSATGIGQMDKKIENLLIRFANPVCFVLNRPNNVHTLSKKN